MRLKILIVGQNPTRKNTNILIPFNGTKTGETLGRWMETMGFTSYNCSTHFINCSNDPGCRFDSRDIRISSFFVVKTIDNTNPDKVIALGEIASRVLTKSGVRHHKLPHPSGRNRKLNDKRWLDEQLRLAKEYVWKT